jgi:Fe-S cluster biogenesis protein NfuA/nitrite reductase/ring-hydroxylating ferredoxin subunit
LDDAQARERIAQVERLLEEIEGIADPAARERSLELAQALLDLYGEGLGRIVGIVAAGDDGRLADALADDELVSHLLLLHGLHPVPLEARVRGALETVRPYLDSHGGDVELLAIEGSAVRLRLDGSCNGCPSSAVTLKLAIEDAIHRAAPEVEEVLAEGADEPQAPQLIQLEMHGPSRRSAEGADAPAPAEPTWEIAGAMPELAGPLEGPLVKRVGGERLMFIRVDERYYAYRPVCPRCGGWLAEATIAGAEIACPGCGGRYDVVRAGRGVDDPDLHLAPIPLLVDESGLVKVAVEAAA